MHFDQDYVVLHLLSCNEITKKQIHPRNNSLEFKSQD